MTWFVLRRPALVFAAALLLAGCGGSSLGKQALQQEAKGLRALAAEGSVLAGDASRGRSTVVFTRIHSRYLRASAQKSVTTLAAGKTAEARRLAALAVRLRDDLDRLSRSGSNQAEQRTLQHDLATIAAKSS
jgi:ATP-dependent protease HslVU (ClpYQ) peptidase subunit